MRSSAQVSIIGAMSTSRRTFLSTAAGAATLTSACSNPPPNPDLQGEAPAAQMTLSEFEPKSMLVTPENPVDRARFPVIDMHTHVSGLTRREPQPDDPLQGTPEERFAKIVSWMDETNLQTMVNLTGGTGDELQQNIEKMQNAHPGRYLICTVPTYDKIREADYPQWQADELGRAKEAGAKGLKISKTLGLYLRENGDGTPLVKIDDPRFDPMWDAAGKLGLPVFIHIADPDAFFTPTDRFNERWEELGNHPNWSFYGKDYPQKAELLAARNRVIEKHPGTTFVCLHVANHPENLDEVSAWLDRYANMNVEIGARLGELGRQPRRARKFFEDYQDRILYGTDASPHGSAVPQQDLTPAMFRCYFRFLETLDEYFDYSPAATPPQGRWKIYGIGLPDEILKKVYHNNAARIMGLQAV
jgi:predicted TIM-barrel fold metal-dependent hydrolase